MTFTRDDPNTWPYFKPLIMAHDVARSHDYSTAVIGGSCPIGPRLLGIKELEELPQGLYGSARAAELAKIDRRHNSNALIVFDASRDETYAEVLYETFGGARLIGLQIVRNGNGMSFQPWRVKNDAIRVYVIGRSNLLELFHNELVSSQVRFADGPMSRRAYEQLMNLETEIGENGIVYRCPSGQHDDLGISCAMLAWAARHPHLEDWFGIFERSRTIRKPRREPFGWAAFT
jgi:hypothetical protein